jgi:hypothetical protein
MKYPKVKPNIAEENVIRGEAAQNKHRPVDRPAVPAATAMKMENRSRRIGSSRPDADGCAHSLLDLLVQRMPAEVGVVFHLLDALREDLLVARGKIPGDRFPFLAGFGALECDKFL